MKKHTLLLTASLSGVTLGLVSCSAPSARVTSSNSPSTQSVTTAQGQNDQYRPISINVWEVDEKGTKVEARLGTMEKALKQVVPAVAPSCLSIKNLATNETIFQENSTDTPLYAYVRALNDDVGKALVVAWAGGSADRIEILDVEAGGARVILKESYRIDAALVDLSGVGSIDVFITTADGGAGPFYTTRYVWKGDRYQPAGRVLYEKLANTISGQFGTQQRAPANPSR